MKKIFSKKDIVRNSGCYSWDKLNSCSFIRLKKITLVDILKSEIPMKDKFWFCCNNLFSAKQNAEVSIGVAKIVRPLFEEKYPNAMATGYLNLTTRAYHFARAAEGHNLDAELLDYLIDYCNKN